MARPTDLTERSASTLAEMIARRDVSATEVATAFLKRIERLDRELRAFSHCDVTDVLNQAGRADRELRDSGPRGPLHGVPVAVKDLILTRGVPTTGGSTAYRDFVPERDDVVVARLRDAGAIILGKTNVATFGFGPPTTNALTGATLNPLDRTRSLSGSSGGSAAAVAARLAPVALGSDGGGSIRVPASLCGVSGIKPTFGLVPLFPSCRDPSLPGFSGWESLEHIGPIARTTHDLALVLDVIAGLDTRDRHSVPNPIGSFRDRREHIAGLRIGVTTVFGPHPAVDPDMERAVENAAARLSALGGRVERFEVDLPQLSDTLEAIVAVEADIEGLKRLAAHDPDAVNPRILAMVRRDWRFSEIAEAMRVRQDVTIRTGKMFAKFDLVVSPTVPSIGIPSGNGPGPRVGAPVHADPQFLSTFTMPFNLTGSPAISIPITTDDAGMPLSVQLAADRFRDDLLLSVAAELEQE